jgi:hypothetical protein
MNITKICTILIVSLLLVSAFAAFNPIFGEDDVDVNPHDVDLNSSNREVWLSEKPSETSFLMYNLKVQIWATVKNTEDHVQYFKISETYHGDLAENQSIPWIITNTKPTAVKMVKTSAQHDDADDYGWAIPKEGKKSVYFALRANKQLGKSSNANYISNGEQSNDTYWPLLNEPGLWASWFNPDELSTLNPTLDVVNWTGKFSFRVKNKADQKVSGIVRAPIVPVSSSLVSQSPAKGKFVDDESMPSANTAAWDVTLGPGQERSFSYTYHYPSKHDSVGPEKKSTNVKTDKTKKDNSKVPTQKTGLPLGLLAIGALAAIGGAGYAKFKK